MAEMQNWCYADACIEQISDDMLMCQRHWDMVPLDVQEEVSRCRQEPILLTVAYQKAINAARTAVRKATIKERKHDV